MKIIFTAVLTLFLSVFLYAQEIVFEQQIEEIPQEAGAVSDEIQDNKEETKQEESLEEFLKKQEELWLKERGENTNAEKVKLKAPSVLDENNINISVGDNKIPAAKSETETMQEDKISAKKAVEPAKKNVNKTGNKDLSIPQEDTPLVKNEPAVQFPQELPADESTERSNWPAFFKGLAFTLVLGIGVWLACKYQ